MNNHNMPTIRFLPFTSLPGTLQQQLMKVFESAQLFVDKHMTDPFPNTLRTQQCSKRLNALLGYPKSTSKFEYFDIVLSRNTVLPKHIDSKNDNRVGYNLCAVYTFFQQIGDLDYKVSIIMTTRNDVGKAFDRAWSSG